MAGPVKVGRYLMFEAFAVGGTAQVHFGRLVGPAGFSRTFAIKRLHPHLAGNFDFTTMLLDEARLAARIRHPSVVPVFEVVQVAGELLLVMEWVPGVSLARLAKYAAARGERIPVAIVIAIVLDALAGLEAAHQATNDLGQPLQIVHRDVSPQNVLVGTDGLGRVLDFGIAHATERLQLTRTGEVKGKLEYMAPEQVRRTRVDQRTDVYAVSIVLWELFAGVRPYANLEAHEGASGLRDLEILRAICRGVAEPPSKYNPELTPELDRVVMRGLAPDPAERFDSALELARALEASATRAATREVASFVRDLAGHEIDAVAKRLARIEAFVPDGTEPSADAGTLGALDELFSVAAEAPRRPRPPSPVTSSYTEQPEVAPAEIAAASVEPTLTRTVTETQTQTDTETETVPKLANKRRAPISLAIAAALASVLVTIAVARSCRSDAPPTAGANEARATASAAAPALLSVAIEPEPADDAAPSPTIAPADAPSIAAPAPTRRAAAPRAPAKPPPRTKQADCTPPYTLDRDGVRIPKRECFR